MAAPSKRKPPFWQFEVPGNKRCTCGAAWDPKCPTCGTVARGF